MRFTLLSALIGVFSASIMTIIVFWGRKFILKIGGGVLLKTCCLLTALRFLFPFQLLNISSPSFDYPMKGFVEFADQYNFISSIKAYSQFGNGMPERPVILLVVFIVWLLGALFFAAWDFRNYGLLHYRMRKLTLPKRDDLQQVADSVQRSLGKTAPIRVIWNKQITYPAVSGFLRPTVYLPDHTWSVNQLEDIFTHECTHFLHKDSWIKMIVLTIKNVFWWNPCAHLLFWCLELACEYHCDDSVTARWNETRRISHARTMNISLELCEVAQKQTRHKKWKLFKRQPLLSPFALESNKQVVLHRIQTFVDRKEKARTPLVIALMIVFAIAGYSGICFAPSEDYLADSVFSENSCLIDEIYAEYACLLDKHDGTYDVYTDRRYSITVSANSQEIQGGFPIFDTLEEVENYFNIMQQEETQ